MPGDNPDLDGLEEAAWKAVLRAHAGLVTAVDRELMSAHSISLADFDVLKALDATGERGQRMTELAREVLLSPSGLTRRLDGLVKGNLVERRPSPDDGRGLLAVLTDDGRAKLGETKSAYAAAIRKNFTAVLTREQLETLATLLETLPLVASTDGAAAGGQIADVRETAARPAMSV